MLLYVSIKVACGSVSFPRLRGEGWDGGQRAEANTARRGQHSAQKSANPQKVKNPPAGETSLRYQILDA